MIRAICLSGKGIGKALMSKVAQVSKTFLLIDEYPIM